MKMLSIFRGDDAGAGGSLRAGDAPLGKPIGAQRACSVRSGCGQAGPSAADAGGTGPPGAPDAARPRYPTVYENSD